MKITALHIIIIATLGVVIYWYMSQPTETYTKDVYFEGVVWQGVLIKHYRNGDEVATLSDGTQIKWGGEEWIAA